MVRSGPRASGSLERLRPEDLAALLVTEPGQVLGCVMRMNRTPYYHNTLNAVVVVNAILELRRASPLVRGS